VPGAVREYFIAAVQEEWDYVPAGGDMCSGQLANLTEAGAALLEAGADRIGSKYLKARFVEFADASFKTRKAGAAGPAGSGRCVHVRCAAKRVVARLACCGLLRLTRLPCARRSTRLAGSTWAWRARCCARRWATRCA
jgi:hypothetical protein